MATSRDVKMTLSVDTLGEDGVKSLQQSIQTLANQGGSAAPQFQKLADEVARLGEQSHSLAAFQALADQTEALKVKQEAAAASSQKLATTLDSLKVSTDAAKAKQQESTNTLVAAQVALVNAGTAIRTLKADYDNAGKQTKEYRDELKELIAKQAAAKAEVIQLGAAQKVANKELSDATTEQNKAATAYARSEKAAQASAKALKEQENAVREAATATAKLGLAVDDVATAEGTLIASLNKAGAEAQQYSARVQEMAESDRLLAIQQRGLAELYARGAAALQAETLAQRDAARSNAEYDASLAKVNAEKAKMADNAAQWQREADALVAASLSAQKLERDTAKLVATERELAGINAFEKQYVEAQKLRQAADYVRFWTTELDKAELATKQMQDAFNTLNVRSADTIRADIAAVRSALETVEAQATATGQTMSGAFDAGKAKIAALELEMRQLNGTMTMGDKASRVLSNSLGQISAGNLVADGVGYLVNKVKEMGQAFLDAVVQGDQMRRGLNAIYKDTAVTAQQIDFLRKTASESGVSLGALSGEFVRFSASMKSANVPMAESNALFRAVTAASASLGLGAEATSGALNALGQMASKGTVSMEELRQQLGDRLPGALGLAAKGMGITEAQLIALVSSGGLATRDFIVPFTRALETMRGEVDGLTPAWGRFGTALTTISQNAGDAGWVQILTVALKGLAGVVGTVVMTFSLASEGILFLSKALTAAAARMMGDKDAFKFLAEEADKAANRINASNAALVAVLDPSKAAAGATTAHAAALTANTAEVTKSIAANTALSAEQKLTALSTALAGDKTLDASAKMVQYNVAAAELLKAQSQQTDAFEKLAKAAKDQGAALVESARLTGDNTEVQLAGLQAAQLYAAALDKSATSQAAETATLVAQKVELEASAAARGLTALQIKTQVDEIDKLILASQSETEQARQAQAAANAEVLARQLVSAALLDNSGRLDAYREAVTAAQAEVDRLRVLESEGSVVKDSLAAAQARLTTATFMHRDAISDLIAQMKLETDVKSANLQLSIAQATASQNHYTAMAAEARASGNVALAVQYEVSAKQEAIRVLRLKLELDKLQQQADLLIIEAKKKLINVETEEGKQKLKLLEIETQMIKIKATGNQAILDQIRVLEAQNNAIRNSTSGAGNYTGSMNSATAATNAFTGSVRQSTAALREQEKAAADAAYSAALGDAVTNEYNSSHASLLRKLNSGDITADDLEEAQGIFDAAEANLETFRNLGGLQSVNSIPSMERRYNEARRVLEEAKNDQARSSYEEQGRLPNGSLPRTTTSTTPSATTPGTASGTKTVNITINGRSQSVNVASDADANALTSILRSLESAANTSS